MFRESERGLFDNSFYGSLRVGDIRFEHVDSQRVQPRVDHLADLLPVETLPRLVPSVGFCLPVVPDGAERGSPGKGPGRVDAFLRSMSFCVAPGVLRATGFRIRLASAVPGHRFDTGPRRQVRPDETRWERRLLSMALARSFRTGRSRSRSRFIGRAAGSLVCRHVRSAGRRRHAVRLLPLECRSGVVPACRVRCSGFPTAVPSCRGGSSSQTIR